MARRCHQQNERGGGGVNETKEGECVFILSPYQNIMCSEPGLLIAYQFSFLPQLRVISPGGVQTAIVSLPGVPVSIAGHGARLLIAYSTNMSFEGRQGDIGHTLKEASFEINAELLGFC